MDGEVTFPDRLALIDGGMRNGTRIFILDHPFRYESSKGVIVVPKGFATDGASIPKCFWNVFDPFGPYFHSALIHDFLYSSQNTTFTRLESDEIFKEGMSHLGINWITRELIFRSVRLFGWRFYKGFEE